MDTESVLLNELLTKDDFAQMLQQTEATLKEAINDLNKSRKQVRQCFSEYMHSIIQNDLKSRETQVAYIIKKNPDYIIIFDCFDDNTERVNRLLRVRENVHRLMSYSQTEMKLI